MSDPKRIRMHTGKGFIAALDQSGGSTPKALRLYGIAEDAYHSDEEMFDLVHEMRTRIMTCPSFTSEHILAAILFENTMERKVNKGLAPLENGVQLMKEIPQLEELLERAKQRHIFGTKMRSVIRESNTDGIRAIVEQQFAIGKRICAAGLVPILEPEVDITASDKADCEVLLKAEIKKHLAKLTADEIIMFKLTIPSVDGFYTELMNDPHVLRIVALSGGYTRDEANVRLARNPGLIASFSRALSQGLCVTQSDDEFEALLKSSIQSIYDASIT